jgi:ribulose-bisphosphate carboxylase large chain
VIRAFYELVAAEPERAAESIAGELSTGTFTRLPGETAELRAAHGAVVESARVVGEQDGLPRAHVALAIPQDNVGADLAALHATLAGNVFEMASVEALRLVDFTLPSDLEAALPGPAFGAAGTRARAGVERRPLIGTIVKPSVGLSPERSAGLAGDVAAAGLDFVKDDELIADPPYSPVTARIRLVTAALAEAAETTGRRAIYAPNVTSGSLDRMVEAAELAVEAGAGSVMVCVHAVGLAGVLALRRRELGPIHGHRAGWGLIGRGPGTAVGPAAHARLWALAGVDQLHVGGLRSKFFESDESVRSSIRICVELGVMPVLSSGQWGGQLPDTVAAAGGGDFLYLAGGAIFGHAMGVRAGVRALRAAADASMRGRRLAEAASERPELAVMLAQFGGLE